MAASRAQPASYRSRWDPKDTRPAMQRGVLHQSIQERAEFLAREIFADRLASEVEIAEAIETEIRRFAKEKFDVWP